MDRDKITLEVAEAFHSLISDTQAVPWHLKLGDTLRELIEEFVTDDWAKKQMLMAVKGMDYAYFTEVFIRPINLAER